jgi:hypothetical protein
LESSSHETVIHRKWCVFGSGVDCSTPPQSTAAASERHGVNPELVIDKVRIAEHRTATISKIHLGRAMVVIVGAIAELGRSLIVQRIKAGMRRGVIYLVDRKLWIDTAPMAQALIFGDYAIHERDHQRYWKQL